MLNAANTMDGQIQKRLIDRFIQHTNTTICINIAL